MTREHRCCYRVDAALSPPIPVMQKLSGPRRFCRLRSCSGAAKSSVPRLTELRTRLDGLLAQICNNRWCLTSKIAGARHCWLGVERAMRKSKEEAAETRARIIRKASKEFNQHGIAGTGLADVMKSAGLTPRRTSSRSPSMMLGRKMVSDLKPIGSRPLRFQWRD